MVPLVLILMTSLPAFALPADFSVPVIDTADQAY